MAGPKRRVRISRQLHGLGCDADWRSEPACLHAQAARRDDPLGGTAVLEHEAVQRVRLVIVLLGTLSLSL